MKEVPARLLFVALVMAMDLAVAWAENALVPPLWCDVWPPEGVCLAHFVLVLTIWLVAAPVLACVMGRGIDRAVRWSWVPTSPFALAVAAFLWQKALAWCGVYWGVEVPVGPADTARALALAAAAIAVALFSAISLQDLVLRRRRPAMARRGEAYAGCSSERAGAAQQGHAADERCMASSSGVRC